MINDYKNQVMRAQALTATAVSASSWGKKTTAQDPSIGRPLSILFFVRVAAGASSTHTFAAIQADDAALTSNVEVLAQSPTIVAAALTAGVYVEVRIPSNSWTKKYIGARDTIASGTTTITLDAFIVPSDQVSKYKSFPKAVPVLV